MVTDLLNPITNSDEATTTPITDETKTEQITEDPKPIAVAAAEP